MEVRLLTRLCLGILVALSRAKLVSTSPVLAAALVTVTVGLQGLATRQVALRLFAHPVRLVTMAMVLHALYALSILTQQPVLRVLGVLTVKSGPREPPLVVLLRMIALHVRQTRTPRLVVLRA